MTTVLQCMFYNDISNSIPLPHPQMTPAIHFHDLTHDYGMSFVLQREKQMGPNYCSQENLSMLQLFPLKATASLQSIIDYSNEGNKEIARIFFFI